MKCMRCKLHLELDLHKQFFYLQRIGTCTRGQSEQKRNGGKGVGTNGNHVHVAA